MTKRQGRMVMVALIVLGVSLAGYLGLKAFNENLLYFFSPTDVAEGKAPKGRSFRLGGMVKDGTVKRTDLDVKFIITDETNDFNVEYTGILPDLFREGQGVITTGSLVAGVFKATEVLAKHDENYMSPEVKDAMDRAKKKKLEAQMEQK